MAEPGGFVITLTPPYSSADSDTPASLLPEAGSRPLILSGALVNHIDQTLLHISRRYEKRCAPADRGINSTIDESSGYTSFTEMATDVESLIDFVWTSGTPKQQTSTLLSIALTSCTSLSAFPFAPRATFHLFKKLDEAFFSLLMGTVADTGQPLRGFEGGRGKPTVTEMIRLRGIAERTRIAVVDAAGREQNEGEGGNVASSRIEEVTDDDFDGDEMSVDTSSDEHEADTEMEIARIYERTISQLGQLLNSM